MIAVACEVLGFGDLGWDVIGRIISQKHEVTSDESRDVIVAVFTTFIIILLNTFVPLT